MGGLACRPELGEMRSATTATRLIKYGHHTRAELHTKHLVYKHKTVEKDEVEHLLVPLFWRSLGGVQLMRYNICVSLRYTLTARDVT